IERNENQWRVTLSGQEPTTVNELSPLPDRGSLGGTEVVVDSRQAHDIQLRTESFGTLEYEVVIVQDGSVVATAPGKLDWDSETQQQIATALDAVPQEMPELVPLTGQLPTFLTATSPIEQGRSGIRLNERGSVQTKDRRLL